MRALVLAAVMLLGVPTPRGSRAIDTTRATSGASYRDSVTFVAKWLGRQGVAVHQIGPYRARGVDVTRFVSDDPATPWLAIHVVRASGATWIAVVPRPT